MTRIVLLTGEDIIEGFIGLISLIITAYILSRIIHAPRSVILGMSFIITWYFRRIGVNVYKYLKAKDMRIACDSRLSFIDAGGVG